MITERIIPANFDNIPNIDTELADKYMELAGKMHNQIHTRIEPTWKELKQTELYKRLTNGTRN